MIEKLPPAVALEFWDDLLPYISRALQFDPYNEFALEDIRSQVEQGYGLILVTIQEETGQLLGATLVTLKQRVIGGKDLHIVTTAGENIQAWLHELVDEVRDIARTEGCEYVTLSGRPGWGKIAHEFGFKVEHVSMAMPVQEAS